MKIDFRKIEVKDIEGTSSYVDISNDLGNAIFQFTTDIGEHDFSREVYLSGEVDVTPERVETIRKYMDMGQFFARVKIGVNKELDKIINPKKQKLC